MALKLDHREDDRPLPEDHLEKQALVMARSDEQQQPEDVTAQSTTSTSSGQVRYLVAVSLALLYFLVPLPAVFNAGNYLSASSSSAFSSLLDLSFSSSAPCHHGHGRASSSSSDDSSLHGRGYRAIFGQQHKNRDTAFYAKGRPSLHAGPRDDTYNSKIEQAFLKVPNNESCIAASRR
jgi:hypothetical protein